MNTQMHTINSAQFQQQDLIVLALLPLIYLFGCYCFKRIVEKCGQEPGFLIWVPILNVIPMLQAAGLSAWLIILLFIPFVNFFVGIYIWAKICQARGKSGWLVILILFPIVNLFFIPYLAFSE